MLTNGYFMVATSTSKAHLGQDIYDFDDKCYLQGLLSQVKIATLSSLLQELTSFSSNFEEEEFYLWPRLWFKSKFFHMRRARFKLPRGVSAMVPSVV